MEDIRLQYIEDIELQPIDSDATESHVQFNGLLDRTKLRIALAALVVGGLSILGNNLLDKDEAKQIERPSLDLETPEQPLEFIREEAKAYVASPERNNLVGELALVQTQKLLNYAMSNPASIEQFVPLQLNDSENENDSTLGHISLFLPGSNTEGSSNYAMMLVRRNAEGNYSLDDDLIDLLITDGDTNISLQSDAYYSAVTELPNKPDGSWHLTLSTLTPERYVVNASASRNAIYMQSADDLNEVDSKVLDLLAHYTDSLDS